MDIGRILIVDDEAPFLLAAKKLLESDDIVVDTAESFEEAKEFLEINRYYAVVSDVRLSGSDCEKGLEIAGIVKRRSPGARVIIVTAHGCADIRDKAIALGADFFFEKPVPIEVLREAVYDHSETESAEKGVIG
jgi:DNA-binding NtrC family response regulator